MPHSYSLKYTNKKGCLWIKCSSQTFFVYESTLHSGQFQTLLKYTNKKWCFSVKCSSKTVFVSDLTLHSGQFQT